MIKGFIQLERIKDGEFETLIELAKKDKHGVYVPTHVVKRDGKIHGYMSVGSPGVPVIFAWLNTEEVRPRESFELINMVENHVALNGAFSVAFPVPKDSPFHGNMEALGYTNCGNYDFFVKKLTE
jgi:hypothetical protein